MKIIWGLGEASLVSLTQAKQGRFSWGFWGCCKLPQQGSLGAEPPYENCLAFLGLYTGLKSIQIW